MTTKAKRFTDNDWDGWAGATEFKDGSQPFLRYLENGAGNDIEIIGDACGICVMFWIDDGDDYRAYGLWNPDDGLTPAMTELIINALPANLTENDMAALGFINDN